MQTLKVNGVDKEYADCVPATLAILLEQLKVDAATVVAEVNGDIVKRDMFESTLLSHGHNIELVRFVPGG